MNKVTEWTRVSKSLEIEESNRKKKNFLNGELILASSKGMINKVIELLQIGAYANCNDSITNPLIAAVDSNNLDIAKILLKASANPCSIVNDQDALWFALKNRKHLFLGLFMQSKIKLNREKDTRKTPLIYAVENSDLYAVRIIAPKVNINEKDRNGNTALHINLAIPNPTNDDIEIGKLLIALGADTKSRNLDGVRPIDIANSEEAKILINKHNLEQIIQPAPEQAADSSLTQEHRPRKNKI